MKEWLRQDPDSCLWYYNDLFSPLYQQKEYDSIEHLCEHLLCAMPENPKKTPDLCYLTGWIISHYYNALMLQEKREGCSRLTDSLLRSSNPFYTQTMRPDLLAETAKFHQIENRIDKVDSIGRLFLDLPSTGDPRRDTRAWHSVALMLEYSTIDPAIPTRLMEYAAKACRQANGKVGNEGGIYSYMGYIYWKNGQYESAMASIQESIDWNEAHPHAIGDGPMHTYCYLSQLYSTLELHKKALETNALAIRCSQEMDNWMLEEMYRLRAISFHKAGEADSALCWVQKALEVTPQSTAQFMLPLLRMNRLEYMYAAHPDSIGFQLDECKGIFPDTTAVSDIVPKTHLLAFYGMALLEKQGHEREGIAYIEQSYQNFLSGNHFEGIVQTGDRLIRAYLQTGMSDRIKQVYPAYIAARDRLLKQQSINAAIGANIRYETGRKEQENRTLAAEVSLKQRTLIFTWLLVGLLAAVLVVGGLYLRQRQRYLRRVSDARLSQISGLLQAQQELSQHNASLTEELHLTANELSEVSSRLDSVSKQKATSTIRVKISTEILNSDMEAEFRRSFTAVYPDYLPALHQLSTDMTSTDELIAMLLLLELSNNEIALTLGISKNGVNKARSRMRQRLGLKSEVVLEEFLKNIFTAE